MLSLEYESAQTTSFNTKKVAAVITAAAGLAVAGVIVSSQKSNTGPKLALVNIPEEFSGTFTNTHDDGRYVVEGVFHKFEHEDGDWQIDGKFTAKGDSHSRWTYLTYTLKDNIFIEETFNLTNDERIRVHCVEPQGFPHYGQGKEIFQKAIAVNDFELVEKSRAKAAEHCAEGAELAVVSDNGNPWVICGDYSNNNFEMTVMNKYITLHAKAVEGMVVDIEYPENYDMERHNCTIENDPVVHFNDFVMKGSSYEHRALDVKPTAWPFVQEERKPEGRRLSPYVCPITGWSRKRCVVFHGVSNEGMNHQDVNVSSRYPEMRDAVYDIGGGNPNGWGGYPEGYDDIPELNQAGYNINGECTFCDLGSVYGRSNFNFASMEACEYSTFADTDTQLRGFHRSALHVEYNVALKATGMMHWNDFAVGGGLDADGYQGRCSHLLFVMTHSMGGLIMQAGLMTGNIVRKGFQWGQVQNPWYGSVAANAGEGMCNWARKLSNPIFLAVMAIITVLTVGAATSAIAICVGPAWLYTIITSSITAWITGLAMIALTAIVSAGIFSSAKGIGREVCIAGGRIGEFFANGSYHHPGNTSIEFHKPIKLTMNAEGGANSIDWDTEDAEFPMMNNVEPFSVYVLNQNKNKKHRAPNWRMCGNHPWGFATDYEANGVFNIVSAKLERIAYSTKKKFDIVTGNDAYREENYGTNPRSYTRNSNHCVSQSDLSNWHPNDEVCNGKWGGNFDRYENTDPAQNDWFHHAGGLNSGTARWSDGCVDATNCMHFALYTLDDDAERLEHFKMNNHHLSASNHDGGTCRAGKATSYYMDPCQRWEGFFSRQVDGGWGVNENVATEYQWYSFITGMSDGDVPNPSINTNNDLDANGITDHENDMMWNPGPAWAPEPDCPDCPPSPAAPIIGKGSGGPPSPNPCVTCPNAFAASDTSDWGGLEWTEEEEALFEENPFTHGNPFAEEQANGGKGGGTTSGRTPGGYKQRKKL
jgi:hypothetical protein